ncbi:MAG TPA: hypothetical protein VMX17_02405 [Candidatus Glassbacteria bacterium]|nr:hypothetical protein [Candidatus Glassbacteria bacterium]
MTKNKTKDVLLGIIGEAQNLKGKPKNEAKEKSVEIYGSTTSVKSIAISDIKNSHSWKLRDDLSDWKNSDFTIYFIQQFRKSINEEWSVDRVAMILYFGRIFDKISEVFGFCDNIVLKDYVDFFLKEWAMYYWKKKGNFTLWYLRDDKPLKDFIGKYDYNDSFNKYVVSKNSHKKNESKKEISKKKIEQCYLAGGESLILEYGLLIPVNWLVKYKNYTIEQANSYIIGAFGFFYSNSNWSKVVSKTEFFNPYPESFVIRDCDIIFQKFNVDTNLKLTFSKENWCDL